MVGRMMQWLSNLPISISVPISHFQLTLACYLSFWLSFSFSFSSPFIPSDAAPALQEPAPILPQIPPWMPLHPLQLQLQDPLPRPNPHRQTRNLFYQMVHPNHQMNWIQNQNIMNSVVQLVLYSFQPLFPFSLIYYSSSVIMKLDVNCYLSITIPFGYWWKRV